MMKRLADIILIKETSMDKLLKKIVNKDKSNERKIYYKPKEIEKIENAIIKLRHRKVAYKKIVSILANKNIKISEGYINNVMKRNN